MNSVNLIGRMTKDPEVKYGASSQNAYCRFSIAIDRGKDRDGNDLGADFPTIVCFGKTAENMERFVSKGQQIGVIGSIRTGSYQDKDGKKVYTTEVWANRIEFLGGGESKDKPKEEKKSEYEGFSQLDDELPF